MAGCCLRRQQLQRLGCFGMHDAGSEAIQCDKLSHANILMHFPVQSSWVGAAS